MLNQSISSTRQTFKMISQQQPTFKTNFHPLAHVSKLKNNLTLPTSNLNEFSHKASEPELINTSRLSTLLGTNMNIIDMP